MTIRESLELRSGRHMDSTPSPKDFWSRRDLGSFKEADGWHWVTDKPLTREERREFADHAIAQWNEWANADPSPGGDK